MINRGECAVIVTHHVCSKRTQKQKVAGSWRITAGLGKTDERHVFTLRWLQPVPVEQNGGTPVPAEPAPAT
jgi:hypothetical protein